MKADEFTVVCWASETFAKHSAGLREDCRSFGYPFRLYCDGGRYSSSVTASYNHPAVILRAVEEYGTILFLDAECRIVRPLPADWQAPLISVRTPAQKFWIRYNSGTMILDQNCVPWLETWLRIMKRWNFDEVSPDDYIHWPGDICDELALHAALAAHGIHPREMPLQYVDRSGPAAIARGYWTNETTIIQHPTEHHWPDVHDPIEAKKLFEQNFPGDPSALKAVFSGGNRIVGSHGWTFDTDARRYAPDRYFHDHPRPWIDDDVILTACQR